ncbi:metallophosphoesterase family protein [Chloroflexota bacterium]
MRIGLISDTHIPEVAEGIPTQVMDAFRGVDLILHAGDIFAVYVLDELERIAPVLAALGDDDYAGISNRVKARHVLELEGQTLWLVHISPRYLADHSWLEASYPVDYDRVGDGGPDIIVCGHEHHAIVDRFDGILYINPGSPTLLDYRKGLGTVGILELDSGKADVSIVQLE